MIQRTLLTLVAIAFLLASPVQAQEPSSSRSLFVGQTVGVPLSSPFLSDPVGAGLHVSGTSVTRVEFGWRLSGEEGWRAAFGGPTVGVGVMHLRFGESDHLGSPTAGYGFFHWPVLSRGPLELRFDMGFGLAFGWRDFDPLTNSSQVAIGSEVTAMIEFTPTLEARVAKDWSVSVGAGFLHFSNGATSLPNRGFNLFAPTLGVKRVVGGQDSPRRARATEEESVAREESPYSWGVSLWAGVKSLAVNEPGREGDGAYAMNRVAVRGLSVVARRRAGSRSALAAGLDLTADESGGRTHSVERLVGPELSMGERLSLGLTGSYELVMGPASLSTTLGYTVLRSGLDRQVSRFYQKLGVTARPFGPVSLGVAVRASNFAVPEFIEWSVGFRSGL